MEFLRKLVEIIIRKHRQLKRLYRAVFALACIVVFVTSYALTLPAVTLDRETAEASAGIGEFEVQGQAAPESGESGGSTEEDQSEADARSQEESEEDAGSDPELATLPTSSPSMKTWSDEPDLPTMVTIFHSPCGIAVLKVVVDRSTPVNFNFPADVRESRIP